MLYPETQFKTNGSLVIALQLFRYNFKLPAYEHTAFIDSVGSAACWGLCCDIDGWLDGRPLVDEKTSFGSLKTY